MSSERIQYSRILISGAGFLADAYDLFVINVAIDLMAEVPYLQTLTPGLKSSTKSIALIGAVIGQIGFGSLADVIGRRKVFIATCTLVIISALLSASVQDIPGPFGIYSQLTLCRFFLGVGVGGRKSFSWPVFVKITFQVNIR